MTIKKININALEREIQQAHRTCENFQSETCLYQGEPEACPRISAVRRDYQMLAFHDNQEIHYGVRI